MDEMVLLIGLLAFAYIGNALMASGQVGALGLPGGAHIMGLGFLLGPNVLAAVPSDAAESFRPLAIVATSWLALVLGSGYGYAEDRRMSLRAFVLGFGFCVLSAGCVGASVYVVARQLVNLPERDCQVLAWGIALAGCETARQSVRWAVDRGAQSEPLLRLLEELADTDEIVPLLGVAVLFAMVPQPGSHLPATFSAGLGLPLLLGIVLGSTAALLVSSLSHAQDAWGVLLGAALLGTGIAWRLALSPVTALFVMGVCLSLGTRHAHELRGQLSRSLPGVLFPTLLLAGALVRLPGDPLELWVVGAAVTVRLVTRWVLGFATAGFTKAGKGRRASFGLSLCCTGTINALVALTFAFRFPNSVGDTVLMTAAVSGILGDLLGTLGLRRAFVAHERMLSRVAVSST